MLLAIDIGNTNITMGVFSWGDRLLYHFAIPTNTKSYRSIISKIVNKYKIKNSILCSVVPKITQAFSKNLNKLISGKSIIIGKDIRVPIRNNYRNPGQVGQDRLVNAYAGVKLYGTPLIVVDFGTAITFDLISKNKAYEGGVILPGLEISLEALNSRTALLPKIKLAAPRRLIGKDTKNSMLSGIVYGFAAMTENLIIKFKKELGHDTKVILTGGNSNLISKYCSNINCTDPLLTLRGINLIYKKIS